jgi:prevent-host-death family protein
MMGAMDLMERARHVSVTEASAQGVSGLIREASTVGDLVVTRHGQPVVAVVSAQRLDDLGRLEEQLRDAALALVRVATDSGARTSLDDAIAAFGFNRDELEAELKADLAAGRQ